MIFEILIVTLSFIVISFILTQITIPLILGTELFWIFKPNSPAMKYFRLSKKIKISELEKEILQKENGSLEDFFELTNKNKEKERR
ncbi:MAG: hypothetical protein WC783_00300 [Candidatus Paceibacterota bacterium]|jgi:hypothetical protein